MREFNVTFALSSALEPTIRQSAFLTQDETAVEHNTQLYPGWNQESNLGPINWQSSTLPIDMLRKFSEVMTDVPIPFGGPMRFLSAFTIDWLSSSHSAEESICPFPSCPG